MTGESLQKVLDRAAQPTRERIVSDAATVEEPIRSIVREVGTGFLDEDLNVTTALERAGVSSNSAKTRFHIMLGVPVRRYIEQARLETAIRMFQLDPSLSVASVAIAVGYRNENTFRVAFPRVFGKTPGELRKDLVDGKVQISEISWGAVKSHNFRNSSGSNSSVATEEVPQGDNQQLLSPDLEKRLVEEVLWPHLKILDQEHRRRLVGLGHIFQTEAPARFFMAKSREMARKSREKSVECAEIALEACFVACHNLKADAFRALQAEAWINLGSALRSASDPVAAEHALTRAETIMNEFSPPPRLQAQLYSHKAWLKSFRREFQEAEQFYSAALGLWQEVDDYLELATLYLGRGYNRELQDQLPDAVGDYLRASLLLERTDFPDNYLLLSIYHRLSSAKLKAGSLKESLRYIELAKSILVLQNNASARAHLQWLEGLIFHSRRQLEAAEQSLGEARSGLYEVGETANVAVLDLDLAILFLEMNRPRESQCRAGEALQVLATMQLEREAVVALKVVRRAVGLGILKFEQLESLRDHLSFLGIPSSVRDGKS